MPHKKNHKKIPSDVRRQIRRRAKVESGRRGAEAIQGTAVGRVLRKKFTKSKTGIKKVGTGSKLDAKGPNKPHKPKLEESGARYRKFEPKKGGGTKQTERFDSDAKSESALKKDVQSKAKKAGVTVTPKSTSSFTTKEGEKTFKRNIEKKQEQKKVAGPKYKKGARTEAQKEKSRSLKEARSRHIREAGGKVGKGERKFKRVLKERMKEEYRKGKYKKY